MKKLVFIPLLMPLLILLLATVSTGYSLNTKLETPIEMVAFSSLSEEEKGLIPVSPKDSIVQKVTVHEKIKPYIDQAYGREEIYSVTFNRTATDVNGDLAVFISLDKKTVIGKSFNQKQE